MAILTDIQGQTSPQVNLNRVHVDLFTVQVTRGDNPVISVQSSQCMYGKSPEGERVYCPKDLPRIGIADIDKEIASLEPADQVAAMSAFGKIQEGLGELIDLKLGIGFNGVE